MNPVRNFTAKFVATGGTGDGLGNPSNRRRGIQVATRRTGRPEGDQNR